MDGKSASLLPMDIWCKAVLCTWVRPLLERMDLWEVLCEMVFRNAYINKNERVAGYKMESGTIHSII